MSASEGVQIAVIRGAPTETETAALVTAVLALSASAGGHEPRISPAWSRAARIEATGQAPFVASSDPRLTVYSTAT